MILMKGERTGTAAEGCFGILVMADEEFPNTIFAHAVRMVYGELEQVMGIWNYRYSLTEEDAVQLRERCTPEEYEIALQCDRFFLVTPETNNSKELPPTLRKYGEMVTEQLKQLAR